MNKKLHQISLNSADARAMRYLLFSLDQVRALLEQGTLPLADALTLCREMRSFFTDRFPAQGEGEAVFDALYAPDLRATLQFVYD